MAGFTPEQKLKLVQTVLPIAQQNNLGRAHRLLLKDTASGGLGYTLDDLAGFTPEQKLALAQTVGGVISDNREREEHRERTVTAGDAWRDDRRIDNIITAQISSGETVTFDPSKPYDPEELADAMDRAQMAMADDPTGESERTLNQLIRYSQTVKGTDRRTTGDEALAWERDRGFLQRHPVLGLTAATSAGVLASTAGAASNLPTSLQMGYVGAGSAPLASFTLEEWKARLGGGRNYYMDAQGRLRTDLILDTGIEGAGLGFIAAVPGQYALRPTQALGSRILGGSQRSGVRGRVGEEVGGWVGEGFGETVLLDVPMTIASERRLLSPREFAQTLGGNIYAEPFEDAVAGVGRRGARFGKGITTPTSLPPGVEIYSTQDVEHGPHAVSLPDGTTLQFQTRQQQLDAAQAYGTRVASSEE